jgi:hypothetical protein
MVSAGSTHINYCIDVQGVGEIIPYSNAPNKGQEQVQFNPTINDESVYIGLPLLWEKNPIGETCKFVKGKLENGSTIRPKLTSFLIFFSTISGYWEADIKLFDSLVTLGPS